MPCTQLLLATNCPLGSVCRRPAAPLGEMRFAPEPRLWLACASSASPPLPSVRNGTRAMPPARHLAVSHRLPPHLAVCRCGGTGCTIPTVPPSAAATTFEFFPFLASGTSLRNSAREAKECLFPSCATRYPESCTFYPVTAAVSPTQPASTAERGWEKEGTLCRSFRYAAIPSNWQLSQPLAHTTLSGSNVLYKHQLISQQHCLRRSTASTATPARRPHRRPLARESVAGHPALLPSAGFQRPRGSAGPCQVSPQCRETPCV